MVEEDVDIIISVRVQYYICELINEGFNVMFLTRKRVWDVPDIAFGKLTP